MSVIFSFFRWEEVRDCGETLSAVRPGVFVRQREADERRGSVGKTGGDTVNEAALGLELGQHATLELSFLQETGEPHLLPAEHGNELRVGKLPAQEGVGQGFRPKRVTRFEPVAVLGLGEIGEFKINLGLQVRTNILFYRRFLIFDDFGKALGYVADAVKTREDVLSFQIDRAEVREPIKPQRPEILAVQELRGIPTPVERAGQFVPYDRTPGETSGQAFGTFGILVEGSSGRTHLHLRLKPTPGSLLALDDVF